MAASLVVSPYFATPARADNQMGYRVVSQQAAAGLPHNRGSLGLDVERSQQISDQGLTFDLIRVKSVRRGSPGAQAGLGAGDQIIAVDGLVFASLAAFAGYIGSLPPGTRANVDYIPASGGPGQAQRVAVVIGGAGTSGANASRQGMSTGEKVAIGVGAAALIGCYEMGCFSHRATPPAGQQNNPAAATPDSQPDPFAPAGATRP